MLLQTAVRLLSQPLERVEPVKSRRGPDSKQEPARVLGAERRASPNHQAAVVHFGSRALRLARSQPPSAEGALVDPLDTTPAGTAPVATTAAGTTSVDRTPTAAEPDGGTPGSATLAASTLAASTPPGATPAETSAAGGAAGAAETSGAEPEELSDEQQQSVDQMKRRDREVRTHEQAHKAAGGSYAGSMRLQFQMGPDGKRYAVEGSVPIDVSPVAGDPAATVRKMEVVSRAANAPASPSGADRSVAGQASRAMQQARAQLAAERYASTRDALPGA